MSLPTSEYIPPEEEQSIPPARRRKRRRSLIPAAAGERSAFLEELAHRLTPSADFFLFSLVCGLVLGAAILLNQTALYVLAALLAPFMAPAVGLGLAASVGSIRFFLQSAGAMITGSLLVFACGAGAGWLSHLWPGLDISRSGDYAHFGWAHILLLTVGTVLTVLMLVRSRQSRPLVAGAAIAYELFLPVGVAGFGLTSGAAGLWPDGLLVFLVHLAWTALVGTIMMVLLGLRPFNMLGYTLGTSMALLTVVALVIVSGFGAAATTHVALPTATRTATATATLTPPPTGTPQPPTLTFTPTNTLVPTPTHTVTISPVPTPVYARIKPNELGGAVMRQEPFSGAPIVKFLSNDMLIIVLSEQVQTDNQTWVKARTTDENPVEGWILRSLLITATPSPGW